MATIIAVSPEPHKIHYIFVFLPLFYSQNKVVGSLRRKFFAACRRISSLQYSTCGHSLHSSALIAASIRGPRSPGNPLKWIFVGMMLFVVTIRTALTNAPVGSEGGTTSRVTLSQANVSATRQKVAPAFVVQKVFCVSEQLVMVDTSAFIFRFVSWIKQNVSEFFILMLHSPRPQQCPSGAVPPELMRLHPSPPVLQWKPNPFRIQDLNLSILTEAEHHRIVPHIQVERDHITEPIVNVGSLLSCTSTPEEVLAVSS